MGKRRAKKLETEPQRILQESQNQNPRASENVVKVTNNARIAEEDKREGGGGGKLHVRASDFVPKLEFGSCDV
ncbi:hypothetical protein EUGRSUZ_E00554 [Eucalyptus grandis]|uniref:Uncharacterized protein n=2 Tax=Eucalyptus grandis TaxID=71139 RepID=A0ACC3KSZ3_EUCGR|nr:hypothetical protein EUGRSUZ_E00554 [Eucalyptus grandis]